MRFTIIVAALLLAGCSDTNPISVTQPVTGSLTAPSHCIKDDQVVPSCIIDELEKNRKSRAEAWTTGCDTDFHGTVQQRCWARNGNLLAVYYLAEQGPYVSVGGCSHSRQPNVVRVDNGKVHTVSVGDNWRPSSPKVVAEMLKGKVAYSTCVDWPDGTAVHHENPLVGFSEAYAKLLELKRTSPARA
jgi:hypothetical protein